MKGEKLETVIILLKKDWKHTAHQHFASGTILRVDKNTAEALIKEGIAERKEE